MCVAMCIVKLGRCALRSCMYEKGGMFRGPRAVCMCVAVVADGGGLVLSI